MLCHKIHLQNFRNYDDQFIELDQDKPVTILHGQNAQGKTNFLEALYVTSVTKSFRTNKTEELIKQNENTAGIDIAFDDKNGQHRMKMQFHKEGQRISKNLTFDNEEKRVMDFIGLMQVVLFEPNDMNVLLLSPGLRRRYFDILISQIDREYLDCLARYNKILKSRNKLLLNILQEKSAPDELYYWDSELVKSGSYLIWRRNEILEFFKEKLPDFYKTISGKDDEIELEYKANFLPYVDLRNTQEGFMQKLTENRSRDIRQATTTVGPHRDDYVFYLNGADIATQGSRGELRTLMLSLKYAEITLFEEVTGESPILLLDDVFSELDEHRKTHLVEMIQGRQCIITTVDTAQCQHLMDTMEEKVTLYKVEDGSIA